MTQLESTKTITKKYSYQISIWGYGGEHHIGVLENQMAEYWLKDGREFFSDYVKATSSWRDEYVRDYNQFLMSKDANSF